MNAIYRCKAVDGSIVEIDADTYDAVGVIKNLGKIVHGKTIVDVLTEIPLSQRYEDKIAVSLPAPLRRFIDVRMGQHGNLIGPFSAYILKKKIKPERYAYLLKVFVEREKKENEERDDELKLMKTKCSERRRDERTAKSNDDTKEA